VAVTVVTYFTFTCLLGWLQAPCLAQQVSFAASSIFCCSSHMALNQKLLGRPGILHCPVGQHCCCLIFLVASFGLEEAVSELFLEDVLHLILIDRFASSPAYGIHFPCAFMNSAGRFQHQAFILYDCGRGRSPFPLRSLHTHILLFSLQQGQRLVQS